MKTINDLKLSKKAKAVVKTWLDEWLNMFIAQANGRQGTVHRADFVKDDFFYFTDCQDILSKNPEAKGQEDNIKIIKRKQKVMFQLLIKTMLGTLVCKKIKCSHCGYPERYIGPLSNKTGHFMYCPKCCYTTICTYPDGYETCISDIRNYKRRLVAKEFVTPTKKAKQECEKYGIQMAEDIANITNLKVCKCKDTPQYKKSCANCKYGPHNDRTKVCHTCVDNKNWKSKECICGDDCKCKKANV